MSKFDRNNGNARSRMSCKLRAAIISSMALSAVLLTCSTAIAAPEAAPFDDFAAYLSKNKASKTIRLSSAQQVRSNARALRFTSTSKATLNLVPYLESSSSILRIADVLKAQKIDPKIRAIVEVMEFPDRLIIKEQLSYRGDAKACETRGRQLSDKGVICFNHKPNARLQKGDEKQFIAQVAEIRKQLDTLTTSPIPGYSLAELKKMDDKRLFGVALNSGTMEEESYLMIPKVEWKSLAALPLNTSKQNFQIPKAGLTKASTDIYVNTLGALTPKLNMPRSAPIGRATSTELIGNVGVSVPDNLTKTEQTHDTRYLINGFTWGKQYNWAKKFGGCAFFGPCVYAKPYAEVGYGLGLRIPLKVDMDMKRVIKTSNGQLVSFTPTIDINPIDANSTMYSSAGMRQDQLFGGKELVAQASAKVGLKYKVLGSSGNPNKSVGVDLTNYLSSKGNFAPPDTGSSAPIGTAWSPDISGGYFNYGVVGATFHAGAKFEMNGKGLMAQADISDAGARGELNMISSTFPASYKPAVIDGRSYLKVANPLYDASWSATPGFRAKAFVDVWVYSATKNYEFWLDELKIETSNYRFSTHEGTNHGYKLNASNQSVAISAF